MSGAERSSLDRGLRGLRHTALMDVAPPRWRSQPQRDRDRVVGLLAMGQGVPAGRIIRARHPAARQAQPQLGPHVPAGQAFRAAGRAWLDGVGSDDMPARAAVDAACTTPSFRGHHGIVLAESNENGRSHPRRRKGRGRLVFGWCRPTVAAEASAAPDRRTDHLGVGRREVRGDVGRRLGHGHDSVTGIQPLRAGERRRMSAVSFRRAALPGWQIGAGGRRGGQRSWRIGCTWSGTRGRPVVDPRPRSC